MSEPYSDFVPQWLELEEEKSRVQWSPSQPVQLVGQLMQALNEGVANGDLPYSDGVATARHNGGDPRHSVSVLETVEALICAELEKGHGKFYAPY